MYTLVPLSTWSSSCDSYISVRICDNIQFRETAHFVVLGIGASVTLHLRQIDLLLHRNMCENYRIGEVALRRLTHLACKSSNPAVQSTRELGGLRARTTRARVKSGQQRVSVKLGEWHIECEM
jgi:hypothetical protein